MSTKYLCPVCHVLRPLDGNPGGDRFLLLCGHRRPDLLPKSLHAIGLEDLNTPLGAQHWPQLIDVVPAFEERRDK